MSALRGHVEALGLSALGTVHAVVVALGWPYARSFFSTALVEAVYVSK